MFAIAFVFVPWSLFLWKFDEKFTKTVDYVNCFVI